MSQSFKVRYAQEGDMNFIYSTWLKGLYFSCEYFKKIPSQVFFVDYQRIIDSILENPDVFLHVACLPDDQDVILGYSITTQNIIHWIFVKESWRKLGICKALVPESLKRCTHVSNIGRTLMYKYGVSSIYEDKKKEIL